ncbi:alpha/beta hydrolase [Rhodococcus pyridinivorans]|uniref:Pimeloyl-ACP methyl ester carboxylesterase n=1 Tax=Rhodococcus rhodochrous J45 TaxID=935266 RepID=A0A562E1B3_RHORH|nr:MULTISPECIES: alpha/beta hydrolase [Rhodococcus]TWH15524.1 pimeloyl-ACP methyl ester carboxylesterase [Rhodococcus rhodochrous J45]UPK64370.1 alpha/beta hydrolase [Rhodococcus pyridinivorans]UVT25506.1 alpha/beta hydrolase [Rhodococcus pyridinivorans]
MTSAAYRIGAGEPVLLLHGFTLSHHVWHGVAHDLASDYDVLAMTMPGHWGGPKLRQREVGIRGIADGIERDLDALGWGTCHVVGNSLGGQVGFELERRGRARSLAAINPGGGWKRFSMTEFRIGLSFAAQFPSALVARVLGERAVTHRRFQQPILDNASHQPDAVPPGDAANVVRAVSHCSIYLTYLLAGLRDGPLKGVDRVTVPTSLMLSEFDSFLTRAECMQRLLDELPPHVREIGLAGVGHIPMLENPELVASALRAHLTRVVQEQSEASPTRGEVEEG